MGARLFALTSNGPYSGKTTLAKHLEREYGFLVASHSRSLVELYVADWNRVDPNHRLTVEQVYTDKERHRPTLQAFGYTIGFNDPHKAEQWVRYTLREWLQTPQQDVVFDPARGEVQAQVLQDMGFKIVQLEISDDERCRRASLLGKDCSAVMLAINQRPELERGVKHPDISLNAELPVEVLGRILVQTPEDTHGLRIFGATFA